MKAQILFWLVLLLVLSLAATHYAAYGADSPHGHGATVAVTRSHGGTSRGPSQPVPRAPIYRAPINRGPMNPRTYTPRTYTRPGGYPSGIHTGVSTYPNTHYGHMPMTGRQTATVETMRQHVVGTNGMRYIHSQGARYAVPFGGWVTRWQHRYPGLHSAFLHPYAIPPYCVVGCADFWTPYWGIGWYGQPFGFYWGNNFWFGIWSGPVYWPDYVVVPIYVISPISQVEVGQLPPPPGGFRTDTQAELAMLRMMAAPSALDATAGLYDGSNGFAPTAPGPRLTAEMAYGMLRDGGPVYYHPPNGAFERMNNLTDLHT